MSNRRKSKKDRRRVERLMEQAWEAVEGDHLAQAEKISRRAVSEGAMNARVWLERGQILELCGRAEEAEEAFRGALAISPGYGDVLKNLARILIGDGRTEEGVRLQRRLVELSPEDHKAREALKTFMALMPDEESRVDSEMPLPQEDGLRTFGYDWRKVADELEEQGVSRLAGLLTANECLGLRTKFEHDDLFEHEVDLDDHRGRVRYRFFFALFPGSYQCFERRYMPGSHPSQTSGRSGSVLRDDFLSISKPSKMIAGGLGNHAVR